MQTKLLLDMISVETVDYRPIHCIFMTKEAFDAFIKLADLSVPTNDRYTKHLGTFGGIDIKLYTLPLRTEVQEYIDNFLELNGNTPNIVMCN